LGLGTCIPYPITRKEKRRGKRWRKGKGWPRADSTSVEIKKTSSCGDGRRRTALKRENSM